MNTNYDCTKCTHYDVCKILDLVENDKKVRDDLHNLSSIELPDGLELILTCRYFYATTGLQR